jgi:lipid-A-disaccharide synthase
MVRRAAAQRPDAVILVDYPGFNLRFAGECRRLGLKTIYFICPQVWAWNRARIPKMARSINQLISIFPFEARHFQDTGLAVEYVGHPLVDDALAALRAPATELPWGGTPRVALLPGSREQEVGRMLPLFLAAAARLERERPGAGFLLAAASPEIAAVLERETLRCRARPARCGIVTGQTREALRQADGALVASGTATVETALMGCPMVVAYRVAPLTYALGRLLVKTEHIGMVNIIAGRRICPEFIQHEATPQALAAALLPLLLDGPARDAMRADLRAVAQALGPGGAAGRAARAVLASLDA